MYFYLIRKILNHILELIVVLVVVSKELSDDSHLETGALGRKKNPKKMLTKSLLIKDIMITKKIIFIF